MEDYVKTYKEFWEELLTEDGVLNMDQVMRELHDYRLLLDSVPNVYDYVTGGNISKPFTEPSIVCELADIHYEILYSES